MDNQIKKQNNPQKFTHSDHTEFVENKPSEMGLLISALVEKLKEPKADIEKNVKALLSETISKMDLVTREELDRQTALLNSANKKLVELEQHLLLLEKQNK